MKMFGKKITSIVDWFKGIMENYEEVYRDACKDPNFMLMEGRMSGYWMY